jgi:hypothetical protein
MQPEFSLGKYLYGPIGPNLALCQQLIFPESLTLPIDADKARSYSSKGNNDFLNVK